MCRASLSSTPKASGLAYKGGHQYSHRSSVSNSCLACFLFCLLLNLEIHHVHCGILSTTNSSATPPQLVVANHSDNSSFRSQSSKEAYQPQNLVIKSSTPLPHDHNSFQLKVNQIADTTVKRSVNGDSHDHGSHDHDHSSHSHDHSSHSHDHSSHGEGSHDHGSSMKEDVPLPDRRFYIKQLFAKYGNEDVLTFEGFEHLLANLGLNDFAFDHNIKDHRKNTDFVSIHDDKHDHRENGDDHDHDHEQDHVDTKSLSNDHSHDHGHSHDHVPKRVNDGDVVVTEAPIHIHGDHDHDGGDHDHNHDDHDHNHDDHDHNHDDHEHNHDDHEHNHDDHEHNHDDHEHNHDDHGHNHDHGQKHDHETNINATTRRKLFSASEVSSNENVQHKNQSVIQKDKNVGHNHGHSDDHHGHSHNHHGHSHNHHGHSHGGHSNERRGHQPNDDKESTGESLKRKKRNPTRRSVRGIRDVSAHGHDHDGHNHNQQIDQPTDSHDSQQILQPKSIPKCLSAQEILLTFDLEMNSSIRQVDFMEMCPSLILQITEPACRHGMYSRIDSSHDGHNHDQLSASQPRSVWEIPAKVWGFSFLAVTLISLCGLLGVAIVPLMRRMFYNHLLQFLVALAVGTLTGDALLHLLPHAISASGPGHQHDHSSSGDADGHDEHYTAIWKGFTACMGIHFFFIIERVMGIFSQWRQRMNQRRSRAVSTSSFRSPRREAFEQQLSIIDERKSVTPQKSYSRKVSEYHPSPLSRQPSQLQRKLSQQQPAYITRNQSAPHDLDNLSMQKKNLGQSSLKNPAVVGAKLSNHQLDCHSCENIMMVVHPGKSLKQLATAAHHNESHCHSQSKREDDDPVCHSDDEEETEVCISKVNKDYHQNGKSALETSPLAKPADVVLPSVLTDPHHKSDESKTTSFKAHDRRSQLSERGHSHHHHGHGHSHGHGHHGHSHDVPNNVSSVAWMVIMGDGIHNFTDGMAIGAAFATSITAGFSTSIAVFCHELPHELGDFAVLLKAGMSTKQALTYNVVSSVLCLFGMIAGIMVGNINNASYWVFCATAGLFLYISLVDMIPELTVMESKPGESPFLHLFIQNAGILSGFAIMLVIALYEHDIQTIFD